MGVPVVTGDTGDRKIMLGGGRAGVLVNPGSVEALAEGIVYALNDKAHYNLMIDQARVVSEQFRWDRLAQDFVKVYAI